MEIQENVPLAPFTTLGVGGPAKLFARARSASDVVLLFSRASSLGVEVFVLGGGSNVVVSDSGFDGLVIKNELYGTEFHNEFVEVGAGEDWDNFVELSVGRELAGIECLSGIPGTVGGTPVQNVGAYGQEVSESIVSVSCFDRSTGTVVELSAAECGFSYRTSIFNTRDRDRYVVLSVRFSLREGEPPKISYKDLAERFAGRSPTLSETRSTVIAIRREKSMVIDPDDPNSRSAGSFFKNPIVDSSVVDSIAEELEIDRVPQFPVSEGKIKIPAAWLIEQAGFYKGFRLGNAGISLNHALAIVNRGEASAADILAIKQLIEKTVHDKFGIFLQPEPIFVGF